MIQHTDPALAPSERIELSQATLREIRNELQGVRFNSSTGPMQNYFGDDMPADLAIVLEYLTAVNRANAEGVARLMVKEAELRELKRDLAAMRRVLGTV